MTMTTLSPSHYPVIQQLVLKGVVRNMETSMAIGFAIAQSYDLPSEKSDVPESFFYGTHGEEVDCILTCINDIAPIDYKASRTYAAKFFALRHSQRFGLSELAMQRLTCINDGEKIFEKQII